MFPPTRSRRPLPRRLAALAALVLLAVAPPAPAKKGDCAQPVSNGKTPIASDCSYILRVAVGLKACEHCVCDVNASGSTTTLDALACLRKAVGLVVPLQCPSCATVTTTTLDPGGRPSTTSTSTTSTTTTMPVRCTSNAACASLPKGFRCNPILGTCEKPCTRNTDCRDFYECDKPTGYCRPPLLLY